MLHVLALTRLLSGAERLEVNLGSGRGHSVREVIGAVEEVSGRPVPAQQAARREGDPPELVAATARAAELLGWAPVHSDLANIVATAWRWHSSEDARRRAAARGGLNRAAAASLQPRRAPPDRTPSCSTLPLPGRVKPRCRSKRGRR